MGQQRGCGFLGQVPLQDRIGNKKPSFLLGNLSIIFSLFNKIKATDFDYAQRDLFEHIEKGNTSAWTCYVQIMPEADGYKYKWNIFDVTKVWPNAEFPL